MKTYTFEFETCFGEEWDESTSFIDVEAESLDEAWKKIKGKEPFHSVCMSVFCGNERVY